MTGRPRRPLTAAEKQKLLDRAESRERFLASPEFRGAVTGVALGVLIAILLIRIFA